MSTTPATTPAPPSAPAPTGPHPRVHAGPPLRRLIVAELAKITSTNAIWGVVAAALLLCGLAVASPIVGAKDSGLDLATPNAVRKVFGAIGGAEIPALVLGILASAGEFRHGMAEQTFLAVPRRTRMLTAKALALALAGIGLALACTLLALAGALPWLAARHAPLDVFDGELWRVAGGATLAAALYGALGVGLGYLVRGLAAALVIGIGWFLVVESAVLALWDSGGRYLPGGGAAGLARSTTGHVLGQGASGMLLTCWVAAFLALAAWRLQRKDISA